MRFDTMAESAVWTLRNAYKKSKAPFWKSLELELSGPRKNRREINLGHLSNYTKDGDVVVVAGKILGSGEIDHKLSVCAFSFSAAAAKKILNAGGKILFFADLVEQHPNGKGVKIVG
jgi:large subunit ribosomal protein L18e